MKKNFNLSFLAAIAAMMTFCACANDDSLGNDDPANNLQALNFNINLGNMHVTRAGTPEAVQAMTSIDGILKQDVKIGIYTTDADGKEYQKVYKVTSDGTANTATGIEVNNTSTFGKFYWGNTTECKIIEAFSFGETAGTTITPNVAETALAAGQTAGTGLANFAKFTVDVDQSASATPANKELLYWYGRAAYSDYGSGTAINIPLNHQLAKINIVVTTPKQASELTKTMTLHIGKEVSTAFTQAEIDEATATHASGKTTSDPWDRGVVVAGTFQKPSGFDGTYKAATTSDVTSAGKFGTWTLSSDGADINKSIRPRVTVVETGDGGSPQTYVTTYSAVVIPQSFQNAYMFVINYDGAEYVYIGQSADNVTAGNEYTYTITVGPKELNVNQAQITAWSPVNRSATAVLQ